jgi:hypothetical protein
MSQTTVAPSPVEAAILRTVVYADVFAFPISAAEIQHYLIGCQASLADVQAALAESVWLRARLQQQDDHWLLCGHQHKGRGLAEQQSAWLWGQATHYAARLAALPFVRMVALTGSLAMRNAKVGGPPNRPDDIDYLIVTVPGRVWLTRLLAVMVVRWAKLRGVSLCPNYVLAETALAQTEQDLYIAHEICQMIPLAGWPTYLAMRQANQWAATHLPNAQQPFYPMPDLAPRRLAKQWQRALENVLAGPIGDKIEGWEMRRKQRKFWAQAQTTPNQESGAKLDDQQVKGHFQNHKTWILAKYEAELAAQGLTQHSPEVC